MIKQQDTGTVRSVRRGGSGRAALMLSAGTLALVLAQPALAQVGPTTLPSGGTIVTGTGGIDATGADMVVTQTSDRLLIDWDSFDIGSGATVHFEMDATDIAVNRDNAGDPSEIYGALTGDGMIMILNPNGVLFGAGADVNVGSLVATTASLADVSSNLLSFTGAAGAVTVAAGANITVADAGLAAFVAPSVANNGVITATAGQVFLGGAAGFTLDLANDGLLQLTVPTASPLVENHGDIFAAGGRIQMSAAAASALVGAVINVEGVLSVASASSDDGVIVLEAAGNAIEVSDDLAVEGDIEFSARRVFGAGDVDVDDGALTLNIDPDGADTTGETLIADALGVIGAVDGGTTLNLAAGDYAAGASINAANVTVDGGGVARIIADQNGQDGLIVNGTGDGAVIQGLTFIGQADAAYDEFAWGSTITRGVVLRNGAENVTVTNNVITGVRNGILIDGRNDGSIITDNVIDNTKSAISVQYTDGSNLTLTGNAEGAFGNEWGINVHLNGVWNGSTISPSAGSLGANPSAAAQQHLLDLSNANSGMSVYNQAYSASNRTHVHVDANGSPTGQGAAPTPISTVQGGISAVVNGGQVFVADGLYTFTSTLNIDKSLSLIGESMNGVIFDGTAINGYGMEVNADDVTLANFTFQGNNASTNSGHYGIKVQPDTGDASDRVHDFTIQNVAIRGWGGTELDLNGVVGALIDGVIADGQNTKGVGIGLTDSADVTIVNSQTLNNLWGSVALYQTNRYYDQQVDNITIDADLNSFGEALGVFAQSYSEIGLEIGQLNLTGFDFVVRNTGHRANGDEFTFFRTDQDDAVSFALNIGAAETSSIEGWSGTDYTNVFTVVNGLTIGAAIRDVRDGGFINVGAGTYGGFGTAFGGPADLTITGADGAIIDGTGVTGRIVDLRADGTTLSGFTIQGDGGGVAVSVSGRGVTVSGNTITDVLTGVQTTTQYAAGNATITGNTISADYGVSLQNTGNTVSGNTVSAAVEGVGLLQGANSFSGNTLIIAAGGDALNYYGSATYAGLNAASNTVIIEGGGLQGAVDLAGAAGSVDAGAATYDETVTIRHGLTLAGAGMDQTFITGGIATSGAINDLTLSGFSVSGNGGSNTVIRNGGVITGLTMDGVRIDGQSVAGRFGFIGGQIGGDISITNSEFLNINGWAVFDTRSGAGTNQGSVITSAVFSGNVLDNVQGHVNFRHDIAGGAFPDVVFSNNTVTNVGNATNSFGAIFKAFNADVVTFSDNDVSDVGTSGFNPGGEAAYGAVLMVRGASQLNLTGNTFTNNHMVFAVEPNRGLPTTTTITGNTFINNGYSLYMPGTAPAGGVVTFGAGNNFIAGADTVQHIVWRSAGSLDLTGVLFDGQLASDMSLAEQFALEDLITHGVDVAGAGLATVVDGHLFVTQASGSIQRAVDLAAAGNTVNVGAGTFGGFATAFGGPADITIQTVDGAVIDGSGGALGARIVDLRADGTTLSGFTIQSDGNGVGVSISGRGVTVSGNTITDVLTGVQTTTQYAAGNATITGNTISADYGVSLQNTGNAVSGNTVNAAVEGVGLLQGANSFSGNTFTIAAGGDALNYYGSATYAGLNAASNTVVIAGGGLQGALDLAGEAGSVDAGAATYDETVTIRHGLTLSGAGQGDTVINGGIVIAGHAPAGASLDGLTIEGLTINAGAGQTGLIALSNSVDGVYNTTNLTVNDVTINGNGQHAVGLFDVNGATFDNVTINAAAGFNGIEAIGLNGFFMDGGAIHGAATGVNIWELAGYEANGGLVFLGVDFADNRTHLSLEGAGAVLDAILSANSFDRTIHATDGDAIYGDLAHAVGDAAAGSELNLSADTFTLTSALIIDRALSLVGAGQGQTIIDASGASTYGIRVHADDVSLSDFTLSGGSGYGVKVEAAGSPTPDQRRRGFSIADVTIENTGRTGLDLNAVVGAMIDGVTVTGVANGNGISITDSADVTVRNTTTSGNAWGGLALYQRNNIGGGGSDQQLTDIVIEDSNDFGEATSVYVQVYNSALHEVGNLTVGGFDFAVQNDALDGGVSSYVFFDRTLQDAIDRGVNLANASESVVGGWSGTGSDGNLYVGFGDLLGGGQAALSIQTAFDASGDGDVIHIAGGDYGQSATLDEARTVLFDDAGVGLTDLTLTAGAAGSGLGGRVTASGDIVFDGAVILADDLTLTGSGVSLAGVDGSSQNGQTLIIDADAISIGSAGAATALRNLMMFGDTTLTGGVYNAFGFAVSGAATLANDVSITVTGPLSMGSVDGAHDLSIVAGGPAALGAVGANEALASLDVAASTITTAGAATTGAQTYVGALTLNGEYAAGGAFSVNGAATLSGDVSIITQDGDVMLGLIDGAHGLTIGAGAGDVILGPVGSSVAVDDLIVTGGVVTTAGASSTGDQVWSGDEVRLSGGFTTAGGDFTVSGPATLNGATTIATAGGDASLGSVNGAVAGGQAFSVNAGSGSIELGSLGALARLGAVVVRANSTVLTGDAYAANSLSFMGAGADATVRLTELLTTFNTVQSAGQAGAITIAPHLIGTVDGEQGVIFLAGTGGSAGDGAITLGDAGSEDLRLGLMTATGGDFSAATVMLAGDFTSTLSGDQLFTNDTLDTLGDVNATVAGDERGPINAGGSVTLNVGGTSNGAITAGGPVTVTSGGDTNRVITSGGAVVLTSTGGSVGGSVDAEGPVTVNSAGTITGSYASGGDILFVAGQSIDVQVDGDVVQVDAPGGVVTGVFSEISTDETGTFVINGETVVGSGSADARQILIDGFIAPVGGVVGPTGLIQLPVGLALALVSPAGEGEGQRPAVLVNDVDRLGELLRLGYTAIVIQIDESGLLIEEELILADTEQQQAAGAH